MSTVQPLGDKVLLQEIEVQEQQVNGIFIPESAKEKPQEAVIVSLGTGGFDENGNKITFFVKEGDKVLTAKYGGTEVKVNGKEYKIISQKDILAIVK